LILNSISESQQFLNDATIGGVEGVTVCVGVGVGVGSAQSLPTQKLDDSQYAIKSPLGL
jgi:hypothetical protein